LHAERRRCAQCGSSIGGLWATQGFLHEFLRLLSSFCSTFPHQPEDFRRQIAGLFLGTSSWRGLGRFVVLFAHKNLSLVYRVLESMDFLSLCRGSGSDNRRSMVFSKIKWHNLLHDKLLLVTDPIFYELTTKHGKTLFVDSLEPFSVGMA